MFFYLSKIITFLIDPLFIILVLLGASILRLTRNRGRRLILAAIFLILYLLSTGFVANALLTHLENSVSPSPLASHYDAVIVLSGMTGVQHRDAVEFSEAVDRILAGIQLVKTGKADYLIISGGDGSLTQGNRPEAEILKEFAEQWGVAPNQIIVDSRSRNTWENATRTAELLERQPMNKLLLVTSAFHMFRSRGCFKQAGLEVDVLPVDFSAESKAADFRSFLPSSYALARTNRVIHEVVGIIAYQVAGRADYTSAR